MHVPPGALAQQLLELGEVSAHGRADRGAGGEDEVDGHHLVFHEVGIEAHGLAVLVEHRHVGDVEMGDLLDLRRFLNGRSGRGGHLAMVRMGVFLSGDRSGQEKGENDQI